jgi:hypothetical protein
MKGKNKQFHEREIEKMRLSAQAVPVRENGAEKQ